MGETRRPGSPPGLSHFNGSQASRRDGCAAPTDGARGTGGRPRRPRPGGPRHVDRVSVAAAHHLSAPPVMPRTNVSMDRLYTMVTYVERPLAVHESQPGNQLRERQE